MNWESLLINVPSAIAVIYVVKIFLTWISAEKEKDRDLWLNHMSRSADQLSMITVVLSQVKDELKELRTDILRK